MSDMQNSDQASDITPFYQHIEPGVRDIVKLLRDNGINTTASCDHQHYIQYDCGGIFLEVEFIHRLLFNAGLRGYSIETIFGQPPDGFHYHRGTIHLDHW